MDHSYRIKLLLFSLFYVSSLASIKTEHTTNSKNDLAQPLDYEIQDYALKALARPHTGTIYNVQLPSSLCHVSVSVIRLKGGSFTKRGLKIFREFEIPAGVKGKPYSKRLALVYKNLGKKSSEYYSLSGYRLLSPVLSLVAYSAENLSSSNLQQLHLVAEKNPISIRFSDVKSVKNGLTPTCVRFDFQGLASFSEVRQNNTCFTFHEGHFSIVVKSKTSRKWKLWKIFGSLISGFLLGIVLGLSVIWLRSYKKKKEIVKMEQEADLEESLQMVYIGNFKVPMARATRTKPILEESDVP